MMKIIKLIVKDVLIFIGFWVFIILFSALITRIPLFSIYYDDYNLINLFVYLGVFGLLLIFYLNDFKTFFKKFDLKKFLSHYLWIGILGIILMNISSSIIMMFINQLVTNESAVRSTISGSNIVVVFLNLGLVVPVCEETIFRLNFKNLFKNKVLFAICTGLLFGSMHLIGSISANNLIELVYIIPYFIMGFVLSYIYYDSDNILNSILVHMLNNIGTIIILLVVGLWKNSYYS